MSSDDERVHLEGGTERDWLEGLRESDRNDNAPAPPASLEEPRPTTADLIAAGSLGDEGALAVRGMADPERAAAIVAASLEEPEAPPAEWRCVSETRVLPCTPFAPHNNLNKCGWFCRCGHRLADHGPEGCTAGCGCLVASAPAVPVGEPSDTVTLPEMQAACADYAAEAWPGLTIEVEALALAEEVGELARCVVKRHHGNRGTAEDWTAELRREAGDVLLVLCNLAAIEGFDLADAGAERLAVILARDINHDPVRAATGEGSTPTAVDLLRRMRDQHHKTGSYAAGPLLAEADAFLAGEGSTP